VLPFENVRRDMEQDYFADGMMEAIITGYRMHPIND
jgi:TolB-like protein